MRNTHPFCADRALRLNCETLEPRVLLSSVQLIAGGIEGTEQIELQIDQVAVETWTLNNTGGQGFFETFTYESEEPITADQVRVVFTNDQWDPENGIDTNVRLDAIVVDGVRFETEDSSVFSTGTWLPEDGVQPGFRQSEFLHSNGYFQFANTIEPPTGDVNIVINEIHYNPGPDGVVDSDAEFIELYNAGDEAADLSGMSFVGFDLTFAAGTVLEAGEYAIVSPSISLAESTWGVTPIAQFASGGISGGGETIQLIAADGVTVIDEVSYDDEGEWPGGPDGNGPSLELLDPALDNSLASSWAVSLGDPTPAAQNSVFGDPPVVDVVVQVTADPLPNQPITVTAEIAGATTAQLTYLVNFGETVTIEMVNVGGDLWEATIDGQQAGDLVRYRVDSDVAVYPFAGDTIKYHGVVVQNPIDENQLPVFQFFVDDAQWEELTTTELALTNTKIPTVIVWNGVVYDNVTVRVRGGDFSRTNFAKKSLKFELPDGYTIDVGAGYGIDEFGVNADFGDWTSSATTISWEIWNQETASQTTSFNMRVQKDGQFHGVFRFQELYDGAWRQKNGHQDDEFYKAGGGGFGTTPQFDKKTPDDGDYGSIQLINEALTTLSFGSEEQRDWLKANVDIPNVINHMALTALMRHDDQRTQNFYMALDSQTKLWSIVEWDLDRLWLENEDTPTPFTDVSYVNAELMDAVFAVPEFETMYWRRMQTLVDTYLSPEGQQQLVARRNEIIEQLGATNSTLEFEKWGRVDIYASEYFRDQWVLDVAARAEAFAGEIRMPGTASGNTPIVISELHYNPLDEDAEFIELYNNGDEAIDLSGWSIDGIGLDIAHGTVILPNQYLVFTDNLSVFRGQKAGDIFVAGQYSGGLSGGGEAITLLDSNGNTVDFVEYDDKDPWPTTPDGEGYTLALLDVNADNSLASSWQASAQINGTPGRANDSSIDQYELLIYAAGATGNEVITLDIAGKEVATYYLSNFGVRAGDMQVGNFTALRWTSDQAFDISDVRINFVNDFYDAEKGIDYGVAIDRVEIDGVGYESEADDVYSTGTWVDGVGVVPGFLNTQLLNSNGYLQYGVDLNNPPVANDFSVTAEYQTSVEGSLLDNSFDPDGDPLFVSVVNGPANGSLQLGENGVFVYSPNEGFSGTDSFVYQVQDINGATASAVVTIEVGSAPEVPLLSDGNIVQLRNVRYNAWLSISNNDAVTSTSNNSRTQWRLIDPDGDGRFRLQNVSTNRYLDGDYFGVDTTSNSGATGTLWQFVEVAPGQYHLVNTRYNRVLDADGSNRSVDWELLIPESDDRWIISLA